MMRQTLILFSGLFVLSTVFSIPAFAQKTQEEFGKCGYYADALHGRKTASGEFYDKNLLTASHKSLPFGTKIKVTRLDNQKSVVLRVNDRGPYVDGYVTDISRKAAEEIGLIRDGVARVKVVVVEEASAAPKAVAVSSKVLPKELETAALTPVPAASKATPATTAKTPGKAASKTSVAPLTYSTPTTAQPVSAGAQTVGGTSELYQMSVRAMEKSGFGLQVSSLSSTDKLFQEVAKLQAVFPGKVIVNHEEFKDLGAASFKLLVGPFASRKEAEAQQRKAATKGYKKAFVVDLSQE